MAAPAIHPTAVISPESSIDPTCSIGPYCVIDGPVQIAAGTCIGPYVQIVGRTEIGRDCRVHAGCVLGDLPQDRTYAGADSYCRIGDGSVLREHVTIHRGTAADSATVVGQRCLIMVGAHIGHNCRVGNDVTMANGSMLGGYVTVDDRAFLSGNVAVHQFVRIGELAMIGGLAKITQDVVPCFTVDGAGICVGVNRVGMRRAGYRSDEISEACEAYRLLCRTSSSVPTALAQIEATLHGRIGRTIFQFVSAATRRGLHLSSPAADTGH